MAESLRLRMFGAFSVEGAAADTGQFRARKAGALLACLAYFAPEPLSRDRLMEMLWPGADLDSQRNRLNLALSTLRKLLGPDADLLRSDRASIQAETSHFTTDVREFDARLQRADETEDPSE